MNAYDLADRHVTDILHIIKGMGQRGVRVDPARLGEFNSELDGRLEKLVAKFDADPALQGLAGYHPAEGYKRPPTKKATCIACCDLFTNEPTGYTPGTKGKLKKCPTCKGTLLMNVEDTDGLEQVEFPVSGVKIKRWAKRLPFLATSGDQVKAYMLSQGHKVPFDKKGDETTATKQLLVAARHYKDDRYRDFVEYRKIKKLRGTYGEWPLQRRPQLCANSGVISPPLFYVITKFSLKPDTHRLSSISPNVQNIPKDGDLPRMFRRCLVPSPGRKFIKADLASAEALVTGWLANDPAYMRLAMLGTHKYAMARYLGLPVSMEMSDEELKPILNSVKDRDPRLYRQVKIVIYGGNYLAGARTVYNNNPEDFASEAEAKKFLNFCNSLSPKVQTWKKRVMAQAQAKKGLTNPFGYHKPFWDLPGNDGPASCAYLPQSIVAAVMKEIMLQLWFGTSSNPEWEEAGRYMVWQIHDELIFDTPEDRVEIIKPMVKAAFTQAWPQLNNLAFGCSLDVVDSLGD